MDDIKEVFTEEERNWYFTFGVGSEFAKNYVMYVGTFETARWRMFAEFGSEWAFQYSEDEWVTDGVSQAEEFDLTELE